MHPRRNRRIALSAVVLAMTLSGAAVAAAKPAAPPVPKPPTPGTYALTDSQYLTAGRLKVIEVGGHLAVTDLYGKFNAFGKGSCGGVGTVTMTAVVPIRLITVSPRQSVWAVGRGWSDQQVTKSTAAMRFGTKTMRSRISLIFANTLPIGVGDYVFTSGGEIIESANDINCEFIFALKHG